mmetsp:Transcript_24260/g.67275  ORF Transcript_24260/g.67275 Transcript_24260/m.67275 type:complete len:284 (-) Transcript_24260:1712-2563(-)
MRGLFLVFNAWLVAVNAFSTPPPPAAKYNHPTRLTRDNDDNRPHLIFPGGALFFYWQAGFITYLRENGFDLSNVTMAGGSAGALTATLTSANVDFYKATELALDYAKQAGVWDRKGGLQGVWGQTIDDWLEELLPQNVVPLAEQHELTILTTSIPSFQKERFSHFSSRRDLIECNMASVHIPWFLDGQLTTRFRGNRYIDGSFWADRQLYMPRDRHDAPTIIVDHSNDPVLRDCSPIDAVSLAAPEGIWGLIEQGKSYARYMDEETSLLEVVPKKEIGQRTCP